MKISSKFIFILGLLTVCLGGVAIFLNHLGFAQRVLNITFWILLLATLKYIWEIKIGKEQALVTKKVVNFSGKTTALLLIVLLIGIYWRWLLPGPHVANDFPIVLDSVAKSLMDLPRLWTEKGAVGLGEYTIFTTWAYPVAFISGVLANLGVSFVVLERIFLILILLLGIIGIWKLCQYFNLSRFSKVIASLFYLTNTYILLLIDGGQLSIALAYAWFPTCFFLLEKSIYADFKRLLLAGIAISILGFLDIRFIYMLFLLILIRFFYELAYLNYKQFGDWILSWLKIGVVCGLTFLGLHAYWLLPYYKVPLSDVTFAQLVQTVFTSSITLGHSLLLLSPHWYKNVFGNITPLRLEFILIPVLVFLSPILRPKDRRVGFWILIALISVFLAKGASEPLSNLYSFLFLKIPGFALFRDSSKFFFLVGLSYSLLIAVAVDEILKRTSLFPKIQLVISLLLISFVLFLTHPTWQDGMTGTFSQPRLQKEYSQLAEILKSDTTFARIFWIPFTTSLSYSSPEHPIVEAARLVQERPFAIGTKGTYEIFNFLREAPYMGEIFDIFGIGYIVYPYLDPRRDNLHPDNISYYYLFSNQLSKLPWLSKLNNSSLPVWKVKQHQNKFFVAPNIWWVVGSDNLYSEATKSSKLKLSNNALIFSDEYPGFANQIDKISQVKVILNNKNYLDLAASFINSSNLIFPAKELDFEPNQTGWWKREPKNLISWRYFLQTKYGIDNQDFDLGGGWAVAEGNLKLKVKSSQVKEDVLLARVFESTRSGELKFYQNNNLIGQIDTNKAGNNVRWFEIGSLKKDGELTIESAGDINVVNALAILDKEDWTRYKKKAQSLQSRIFDFDGKNIEQDTAAVTYQQINPTKYLVRIRNLKIPSLLIFSATFDKHWMLNGQSPVPVYSLLNGFSIAKDGDYTLDFDTQKYVYPGLIISGLTLVIITFLLFKTRRSQ